MFKNPFPPADRSSRIPPYLQNRTRENVSFQLKLSLVFLAWIGVRGLYDEYKWRKTVKETREIPS